MKFDEQIKALIFDCDGTLVDSMRIHMDAWFSTFKQYGHECSWAFLEERNGITTENIIQDFNRRYKANINIQSFSTDKEKRAFKALDNLTDIPAIANILLQNAPYYPCVVFSGGNRKNVTKSLEVTGLKKYVHHVITSDDHYPSKNDPKAYHKIATLLGLQPKQCHFFEDGEMAVEAAKKAGMQVTTINKKTLAELDAKLLSS